MAEPITVHNYLFHPVINDSDSDPIPELWSNYDSSNMNLKQMYTAVDGDGVKYGDGTKSWARMPITVGGNSGQLESPQVLPAGDYIVLVDLIWAEPTGKKPKIIKPAWFGWTKPATLEDLNDWDVENERIIVKALATYADETPKWGVQLNMTVTHNRQEMYGAALIPLEEYDAAKAAGYEDSDLLFSGETERDGLSASWAGVPHRSISIAEFSTVEPDPDPDPDPEPEPDPEPALPGLFDVSRVVPSIMRLGNIPETEQGQLAVATEVAEVITAMAYAYTRGNGFVETEEGQLATSKPVIRHIIISAGMRLLANPSGLSYRAGSEHIITAFKGWTLGERESLNLYRTRWA